MTEPQALSTPGVVEAAEAIAHGRLRPETLLDACLETIERCEPALNALRWTMAERARVEARACEQALEDGNPVGPLHGVPIAIKDNIAAAGDPWTAATPVREGEVAAQDSEVVARLRRAGAILLARTHMAEWAIGGTSQNLHFGPVRNAWDPERVAGGSSGGSGSAVAAGMVPVALGSDTGGSIRIPACLTGVSGIRPTVGRVSNRATVPVAWSFDTVGPLAGDVRDVARVLGVIAGYDHDDPVCADQPVPDFESELQQGVEGMRIGRLGGYFRDQVDAEIDAAVDAAAEQLEAAGARVDEVELPGIEETVAWTGDLLLAEAAAYHAERFAQAPDSFQPDVRKRLERGSSVTGPRYAEGRREQRRWRRRMLDLLVERDALLTPASPIEAPLLAESDPLEMTARLGSLLTPFVFTQVPALVIPAGFSARGLPLGLQLVGRPFDESSLLRAGHAFQQRTDWHRRRPPLLG